LERHIQRFPKLSPEIVNGVDGVDDAALKSLLFAYNIALAQCDSLAAEGANARGRLAAYEALRDEIEIAIEEVLRDRVRMC